jgi:hypothetical protein
MKIFMHRRFRLTIVLPGLLLLCASNGFAQQGLSQQRSMVHMGTSGSAQGNLTVTATVVSSVGLVMGPDGEQRMIVANAADPSDNVSRLETTGMVTLTSSGDSSAIGNAPKTKKKH